MAHEAVPLWVPHPEQPVQDREEKPWRRPGDENNGFGFGAVIDDSEDDA